MRDSEFEAMRKRDIAARIKRELRASGSKYRFTARGPMAHGDHADSVEESHGDTYCCHRCEVIGIW